MNKIIVGVLLVLLISTVYASDLKREFIPEDLTVSPGGDFTIRFIPETTSSTFYWAIEQNLPEGWTYNNENVIKYTGYGTQSKSFRLTAPEIERVYAFEAGTYMARGTDENDSEIKEYPAFDVNVIAASSETNQTANDAIPANETVETPQTEESNETTNVTETVAETAANETETQVIPETVSTETTTQETTQATAEETTPDTTAEITPQTPVVQVINTPTVKPDVKSILVSVIVLLVVVILVMIYMMSRPKKRTDAEFY